MSLGADLLEQARHLASREPRRPRQASLRRAASAAYYALFHLLVEEASRLVISGTGLGHLRPKLARAFIHAEMKQVSRAFMMSGQGPKLPDEITAMADELHAPPTDLRTVATAFVRLQEERHDADYDLSRRFKRPEVKQMIQTASDAFDAWDRVRTEPLSKAYLLALLVARKWDRN